MFAIDFCSQTIIKLGSLRYSKVFLSILVLFLTGMSYSATIGNLLPVIVGFNAALSGYMVLEKTQTAFKHKRLVAICSGVVTVLITAFLLNVLFIRGAGIYLIDVGELITLVCVGLISSLLGGMLAIKYFNLT